MGAGINQPMVPTRWIADWLTAADGVCALALQVDDATSWTSADRGHLGWTLLL
jgi:hypothetical protein